MSDHMAQRKTAAAEPAAGRPLRLSGPGGRRPRLLLAEDSDPVRIVTAAMLKGMGCDVEAVIHGEEAVQSASARSYDLIVLDIEMPVMDGITAARSIRRMGGGIRQTPIMALSAFLADAMQSAQWSDTFDIALPKPANRNELHAAVKAALACGPQEEMDAAAERAPDREPLIAAAQLAELKAGLTPAVWKELRTVACRDIEDCVGRAVRQLRGEEPGALIVYAQKLKALGRTFAAPRLAAVAQKLEWEVDSGRARPLVTLLRQVAADTVAALIVDHRA
jgi:CheY-like chemotaxis protein